MTLREEAQELRDRICSAAPYTYKQELGENSWELALLCAEAYFKSLHESINKDIQGMVKMYNEGRSVLYIAEAYDYTVSHVASSLHGRVCFVINDPHCSISWLREVEADGLLLAAKLPPNPPQITTKPDDKEIKVLRKMWKTYGTGIIAKHAHRPESMVNYILQTPEGKTEDEIPKGIDSAKVEQACKIYRSGRAPVFIAEIMKTPTSKVEEYLIAGGMPYCRGYDTYTIREFLSIDTSQPKFKPPELSESEANEIRKILDGFDMKRAPSLISGAFDGPEALAVMHWINSNNRGDINKWAPRALGRSFSDYDKIVRWVHESLKKVVSSGGTHT